MTAKVLVVFGTRPEAVKMAPVVHQLKINSALECVVCVTAQHRSMLDQVLSLFKIQPDYDLDLMAPNQDLFDITSKALLGMRTILRDVEPDFVLVQGDTTTCFAAALAAFYENVPVGHIEAGLRTRNKRAPFPEELNRMLTTQVATLHFAPTEQARKNLLIDGVIDADILVTGNTVIDALLEVRDLVNTSQPEEWRRHLGDRAFECAMAVDRKLILITGHRRENFGQGFVDLCSAIRQLAEKYPLWNFIYPVHLNPNVRDPVNRILGALSNVVLIEPLEYAPFVWLMDRSTMILTDSGGIQEEAPALGKPVLVMRDVTERPEGVLAGTVKLVGTNVERIVAGVEEVLLDSSVYDAMSRAHNPFGDGTAGRKIVNAVQKFFA